MGLVHSMVYGREPMSGVKDELRRIEGVQYAIEHGAKLRVVFQHNATSDTLREVERITECVGGFGATQEHRASVDYPLGEIDE